MTVAFCSAKVALHGILLRYFRGAKGDNSGAKGDYLKHFGARFVGSEAEVAVAMVVDT